MIVFFLAVTIIALVGCRVKFRGFREDCLNRKITTSVNGFFILWVFLRHITSYVVDSGYHMSSMLDKWWLFVDGVFAQRIVVLFLFFSGFGVMESIRLKGNEYVVAMPRRRILTTLLNFDIAVFAFLFTAICVGRVSMYTWPQILLAFSGWTSVGNSNWYIFDILLCYLVTYIVCLIPCLRNYRPWGVLGAVGLCVIGLYYCRPDWWYDTLLAYPLGALVSQYRNKLELCFRRHYWWLLCLSGLVIVTYKYIPFDMCGFKGNISTLAFSLGSFLLLMKVKISNPVLEWLGARLFPVYIYQRLPMIILMVVLGKMFVCGHPYCFVALSFLFTVCLAWGFRFWQVKIK